MYGFLDVEESYCFENKCTVKYGEWEMYAFYPEWMSKIHRKYKTAKALLTWQRSSSFLYCFDLFGSLLSWGVYLILIKLMFMSRTGQFTHLCVLFII